MNMELLVLAGYREVAEVALLEHCMAISTCETSHVADVSEWRL